MKCTTNFLKHSEISQNRWYLWLVICCHQLDKVVSWNILYIAIVQNTKRNMSEKNNNCAPFCWNEMFYQEIRQMSQLPPKSRWWGMGPMKRITAICLESRKSLFAKKENLESKPENKRERKMRTARRTNQREIRSESRIYGGCSWYNAIGGKLLLG